MSFEYTKVVMGGENIRNSLEEISREQAVKYSIAGTGGGVNLFHCVNMGLKYCKDFDSVKYYRRCDPGEHPELEKGTNVVYEFYKEKE